MSGKAKAAFIDRDGVINEERNYVHRIEDFVLLPGVVEGLALLRDAGYKLVVVTNQAGIARGYYDQTAMERLHDHLRARLAEGGVVLDGIYFCPHHPQGSIAAFAIECDCRKPAPGMLLQAERDLDLDLAGSVLIGDKLSDIQAGRRAGVHRTVLVESGHAIEASARAEADLVASDLLAAARALAHS
ncbi:D-glycero-beta-D-manno-heptose 1,7-bisphosphate 7-phosphatase [Roseateles chitosanitabidus]|uniref:D-glycero-beta-D-manno-heptose 1,7-bisphosphate 7-phosphatase n=1 Tax=Roseateles chitosanitabidus TaxID=65048 RepID=UPI0008347FC9|nr:D-glycero-beta-D-manno-heptose 1,7-bisphosphate 7-phosphatase [Roseateles chitosanitabidus]